MEGIEFLLKKKARKRAPTLIVAAYNIAKLGGYIGRNNDGFPGPHVMAKGLRRLSDIVKIMKLLGIENFEKFRKIIDKLFYG